VVTNSASYLSQRASACFKVHRDPSAAAVVTKANSSCPSVSEDAVVRSSGADIQCSVVTTAPIPVDKLGEEGKISKDTPGPRIDRPESAGTTELLSEILPDGDEHANTIKISAKQVVKGECGVKDVLPSCSTQESKTCLDDTSSAQHPRIAFAKSAIEFVIPPKTEDRPPLDTAETKAIPQKSEVAGVNSSELCGRSGPTPVEAPTPTDVDCSLIKTSSAPEVVTSSRHSKEAPGVEEASSLIPSLSERETQPSQAQHVSNRSVPASRPSSRSSHSDRLVPNTQYRAATVCAAGVAVALFLVVMRRLALMLHGI
jgi:hypothetical protein